MNLTLLLFAATWHVLPDGDIERAVQLTVRADRIEIRYMIGMNPITLAKKLEQDTSDGGLDDWRTYAVAAQSTITNTLELSLNDRPLKLTALRWRPLPLHILQIECVLEAELPDDIPAGAERRLAIRDKTYAKAPGFARLAVRGVGVENFQSETPPLVARVQRKRLGEMSEAEQKATRVAAASWR